MDIKNQLRYIVSRVPALNSRLINKKINALYKHRIGSEKVAAGEASTTERNRILDECRESDKAYIEKFELNAAKQWEKSYYGRSGFTDRITDDICSDILWCHVAYGFQADEYIMFDFVHKTNEERKKFISDTDRYEVYYRNNNFYDRMVFIDKYDTYKVFSEYYGRKAIKIKTKEDVDSFTKFAKMFKKLVVKNPTLSKGDSVRLIDTSDFSDEQIKEEFYRIVKEGTAIVEELIDQAEELKQFHPSSVNTIRCTTILSENDVIVFYPFIKIGRSGSFVDNGGKGGILAAVDVQNGVICSDGLDEFGEKYTVHPDTHIAIKGYSLPAWEECLDLIKTCARKMKKVRIVGWDLAWTKKGWVIVEGNAQGQFVGQQGTNAKGLRYELLDVLQR